MRNILLLFACLLSATLETQAGDASGQVKNIFIHEPGVLMFRVGDTISNVPSCAQILQQWAINLSDPMAKPLLAVLLTAQTLGKNVYVRGYSNTCRDWPDRELPSFVVVID